MLAQLLQRTRIWGAGWGPCGEEPPDRARESPWMEQGWGSARKGEQAQRSKGSQQPLGPSPCPALGSPLAEPPKVGWGCVGTVSAPHCPSQAGAEGSVPTGTGDTREPPLPAPGTQRARAVPSTQHSTPQHDSTQAQHIHTARQRKHRQAWTSTAGGCETTAVAPGG